MSVKKRLWEKRYNISLHRMLRTLLFSTSLTRTISWRQEINNWSLLFIEVYFDVEKVWKDQLNLQKI